LSSFDVFVEGVFRGASWFIGWSRIRIEKIALANRKLMYAPGEPHGGYGKVDGRHPFYTRVKFSIPSFTPLSKKLSKNIPRTKDFS